MKLVWLVVKVRLLEVRILSVLIFFIREKWHNLGPFIFLQAFLKKWNIGADQLRCFIENRESLSARHCFVEINGKYHVFTKVDS